MICDAQPALFDTLRSDPVFKLIANRTPDDTDLASQPTISRIENSVTPADLLKLEDWFIDRFVESFYGSSAKSVGETCGLFDNFQKYLRCRRLFPCEFRMRDFQGIGSCVQ